MNKPKDICDCCGTELTKELWKLIKEFDESEICTCKVLKEILHLRKHTKELKNDRTNTRTKRRKEK